MRAVTREEIVDYQTWEEKRPEERAAIINSTLPTTSDELDAIRRDISQRLAQLPEVATQRVADLNITTRGGTPAEPIALCIADNATNHCRLAFNVLTDEVGTKHVMT